MLPSHERHPPLAAPSGTVPGRADLDPRRKRALFRAWHRGMREMDLIMGRFADREIGTLSEGELDALERLMEEPDQQVYAWIIGRATPPERIDAALLARLKQHRD